LNKFLLCVSHFVLNKYCDLRQEPKSSVVENTTKCSLYFNRSIHVVNVHDEQRAVSAYKSSLQ